MKNQLKNYLIILTLIFGVSILLLNCEKDNFNETLQNIEKENPYKLKRVKLSEIPQIRDFLIDKTNDNIFKSSEVNGAIFDEDHILELIDTLDRTNYSLRFRYPDTPIGTFYNLIVGKDENGELKTPYVLKYKSNKENLDEYITNNLSLGHFKGKVGIHKYTDFFEVGSFLKSETYCPPEYDEFGDPIPCDEPTVDGNGSGGGGSSSEEPIEGGGGGDGGGITTCTTVLYIMNCGGSNGGSWHTHDSCGGPLKDTTSADYMSEMVCISPEKSAILKSGDDCPDCPDPTGATGVNYPTAVTNLNAIFDNTLTTDQLNYLYANLSIIDKINLFFKQNGITQEAKDFAKAAIDALMNNGEVDFANKLIYNPTQDNWYKARMSDSEVVIFDGLTALQQHLYLKSAIQAYNYAELHYPRPVRNRKGDAVKHSFWNALSTVRLGATLTKQLTDAHEDIAYTLNYDNHFKETDMDFHNNAIGRELANGSGLLIDMVEDALANGDLRYLNHLVLYNNIYYRATDASELIPTNN